MKTFAIGMILMMLLACGSDKSKQVANTLDLSSLSTSLCGAYVAVGEGAIFPGFTFRGNGTGELGTEGLGAETKFLQVHDTLFVFVDQGVFTLLVQPDGKLKDVGEWLGGYMYEKTNADTTTCMSQPANAAELQKELLLTKILTKTFNEITENDLATLESLCDSQNSQACLALANLAMKDAVSKSIFNTEKQEADDEVLAVIQKSIDLGDPAGLTKMGEYYLILYDIDKAKEYYKKACDQEDDDACMKIMEEGWE